MFRLKCIALCFLTYYTIVNAATVSFIKPCKRDDVACIKASAIDAFPRFTVGIPEIGLPPADPIVIDEARADDSKLQLGFRNMEVTGINKCTVLDFVRDLDKSTMTLVLECPLSATGQYNINGQLLFFEIVGDGDFVIKTDKVIIEVIARIKVVETKSEKHWKIMGFDYKYDIIEKASINLENLFGGDETRAKPVREILNNQSNEIIASLGDPIFKKLLTKVMDIVQTFLTAVPISELEIA